MKPIVHSIALAFLIACSGPTDSAKESPTNPFIVDLNESVDYENVTASDLEEYAQLAINDAVVDVESIKNVETATFDNVFVAMDNIVNNIYVAANNCFMLYWVSPDSLSRVKGLASYQQLDSMSTALYSDKDLFNKLLSFQSAEAYGTLKRHRKLLVDDMIQDFKQSGVNLDEAQLAEFKRLNKEINELTSSYSINMNSSDEVLALDEEGAKGLPENFKNTYSTGEFEYEIPIINATRRPVTQNADNEATRKVYHFKFYNRAADKNLEILDDLRSKRHELAQIMNYNTYAAYNLDSKMAKNPETVWAFINDLVDRSKEKAKSDVELLKAMKQNDGSGEFEAWDISYYNNQILKTEYQVDNEKIRE
ncbi:MAG: Zn-dependent oligopeptidase, partial [Cytophagales bacterium]|nr:Zn-dependent oligopeptidase [Cytophagales bacterium]